MQTRRDQLQAYRFLNRRALAALVTGEPNAVDPPMRRLTATTVSGIMIAALVVAGFGILGIIRPSVGDKWKVAGTIIVERETGARYVLIDNELRPVLNFSSAVLAVTASAQSTAKVVLVDRSDLKNTKRGSTIGISGIPDSLPSSGNLITQPWAACSRQEPNTQASLSAKVILYVGTDPATARRLPAESAVIAQTVDGKGDYLLWHGKRLTIGSDQVATSLGIKTAPTVAVGTAFLDALPQGTGLVTPTIADIWSPGPPLGGSPTLVGQTLRVRGTDQYYVVLKHGFMAIDALEASLIQTIPEPNHQFLPVQEINGNVSLTITNSPPSADESSDLNRQFSGLPPSVPEIDPTPSQNAGLCAVYRNSAQPTFEVPPSLVGNSQLGNPTESIPSKQGNADEVDLTPGRAAVVSSNNSSTVYVVADPGKKYAASSITALAGFGYGSVTPVKLPDGLLKLIGEGPALDPTAALQPVSG